jgi:hypothetical protein
MRVLLLHLDGTVPNIALMRLAAHHRDRGDTVELRRADNPRLIGPRLGDPAWDRVYGSLIFERTRPHAELARGLPERAACSSHIGCTLTYTFVRGGQAVGARPRARGGDAARPEPAGDP